LYSFTDSLQLLASFFAHEARIWQSCLTSTHLLTCGEDSSIRLWSHESTGEMLRCFSVHRCKSVWCMDILRDNEDNQPLMIISGWSDGSVRRYYLDDVPIDSQEIVLLNKIIENDFPRNVIFWNSLIMIVHMNNGQLIKIDDGNLSIFYDGRTVLKNGYAKMCIGNEYLAVGSLDGFILIFDKNGIIINKFQIEINKNNKILQILWLNDTAPSKLLVCIPDGMMVNQFFCSLYGNTFSRVIISLKRVVFFLMFCLL
jgi:WD40 repeat protein